ncbi:MAG: SurA N-terminal domain-containing protein [Bauldia sp.]|nr:SurA N-terminal domain-containing protein [Bauldia sp.]
MLSALRSQTSGIITRILLGFLILSFAIWGVSGIFTGFNADTVAKVGPGEIDSNEFAVAYSDQVRQFSQQFGQVITPELSRTLGLSDRVLSQLISDELISVQAEQFGVGISIDKLRQMIQSIPQLQGANGFDRNRLDTILYQNQWTEAQFVDLIRQDEIRRQIQGGTVGGIKVPAVLSRAMQQLVGETRSISYLVLTPELAGEIAAPTDAELTAFMNDTRARWRTPEYRGLTILTAAVSDLADPAAVTAEEARAEYDRQTPRFVEPEKRQVAQILYQDQASAEAALARITAGESFDAVFASPGPNGAATSLGLVARSGFLDPAIADAAFALGAVGEVSPVVDGRFGYALVRVSEIVPEVVTPFESVEATIRGEIAASRARETVLDFYESIEDSRAGGQSFAEIGEALDLPVTVVPAVSRAGNGADGAPVTGLPEQTALLTAAFESDVGLENDPLSTSDGGYLWYEVTEVVPTRDQTLDEVREAVTTAWREQKTSEALVDRASSIAARINAGETMEAIAAELGITVSTATSLNRYGQATGLSNAARDNAFTGEAGHVAIAPGSATGTQLVLRVDAVTVPPPATPTEEEMASIGDEVATDIMQQYLAYLQTQYGVTVNQTLIDTIISTGLY